MLPLVSDVKATPSSTETASGSVRTPGWVESVNSPQGQVPTVGSGCAAVNDQVFAFAMAFPEPSEAVTDAVYAVPFDRAAAGVNVAVRVAPSYVVVPFTLAPPEDFSVNATVLWSTASLNVALGWAVVGTLVEPPSGVVDVTVGGVVSGGAPVLKTGSTQ